MKTLSHILTDARNCTICSEYLPFPPRPIIQASAESKILIIGQAPGLKVQLSGVPWDDASGRELRSWMNVSEEEFYDSKKFAITSMGFCYPGKGKSGDLPPRRECAPQWHQKLREQMPHVQLTLLIGQYAQKQYLKNNRRNLTETVRNYADFLPDFFPLVHPSPRNFIWQSKNPWFKERVVPVLEERVQSILFSDVR